MTVRVANFADIPQIVEIMRRGHERSRYYELTDFNEIESKQLLVRTIQRHGHMNYMGTMVLVSETDESIRGFMIGIIDEVHPGLTGYKVTDLLIIFDEGADPRDFPKMVEAMVAWGQQNPKVVEVFLGIHDAIVDWNLITPIYQKAGLKQCGGMFRATFDRRTEQKAEGF